MYVRQVLYVNFIPLGLYLFGWLLAHLLHTILPLRFFFEYSSLSSICLDSKAQILRNWKYESLFFFLRPVVVSSENSRNELSIPSHGTSSLMRRGGQISKIFYRNTGNSSNVIHYTSYIQNNTSVDLIMHSYFVYKNGWMLNVEVGLECCRVDCIWILCSFRFIWEYHEHAAPFDLQYTIIENALT